MNPANMNGINYIAATYKVYGSWVLTWVNFTLRTDTRHDRGIGDG